MVPLPNQQLRFEAMFYLYAYAGFALLVWLVFRLALSALVYSYLALAVGHNREERRRENLPG